MNRLIIIASLIILVSCAIGIEIKSSVIKSSILTDTLDICRTGIFIMPLWDLKKDSITDKIPIERLNRLLKLSAHKDLKIITHREFYRNFANDSICSGFLYYLEKNIKKIRSDSLTDLLLIKSKTKYFLKITINKGQSVSSFNKQEKISISLTGELFDASKKIIIWSGNSYSAAYTTKTNIDDAIDKTVLALFEILPVHSSIINIRSLENGW